MISLSEGFTRGVVRTWGDDGRRWLADLPAQVTAVVRDWELQLGRPFEMNVQWVVAATCADGGEAVLKLGLPGAHHLADEIATLEAFDGRGAVRLLRSDAARGALLLERVPGEPATTLVPGRDDEATAAAVVVLNRLHRSPPPDCRLPELASQGIAFSDHLRRHQGDTSLPRGLVERAAGLFAELCAGSRRRVVLHGDLHHDNFLRAEREPWLAIDPHGVVGDPGYDVGSLLFNPFVQRRDDDLLALVGARVEQLADGLATGVGDVVAWGFVKAVLSEVWTADDGRAPPTRALDVAKLLQPRLR